MGNKAVTWARQQRTGGPPEKAVLLILAVELDQEGTCRLSTRRIADDANTDTGTAWRALERLRKRGLIEWEKGGGRAPNTYRLACSAVP